MDAAGGRVGATVAVRPRGNEWVQTAQPAWFDGQWAEILPAPAGSDAHSPRPGPPSHGGLVRPDSTALRRGAFQGTAAAAVVAMVAGLLGLSSALAASPPAVPPHRAAPPVTAPPVTAPPVTAPPVTTPPVTAPPVTAPPVTAPPVTAPPVTAPPPGAGVPGVPAEVAGVAQGIIAAIDQRSPANRQIPATADNIVLLGRWMAMEGGLWANNPLNTDLHAGQFPHQHTSSGNDTGTPIFPTMQVGIENAAATLLGNRAYAPILAQLRSGTASCPAFASAVIRSPWAASHYGHNTAGFCGARPSAALGVHGTRPRPHRAPPRRPHRRAKP